MRFEVSEDIFRLFPTACFGVVVAADFQPRDQEMVAQLLTAAVAAAPAKFPDGVRSHPSIRVWREAFTKMQLNPNKFLSSVEALHTRVYKSGHLPQINPIVDLVNALSLKYVLPMGAHDLERMTGDMRLRLSRAGDVFTPFGEQQAEVVPPGEIVYADDVEVRTRRWVWRQGEKAKIVAESRHIFFPIDGFADVNKADVLAARDELAELVTRLGGRATVFFVDCDCPVAEWD